jgi:CxxC motif-containing protein (DUF1111 family)
VLDHGAAQRREDAINRHGNQGAVARNAFNALTSTNKNRLIAFLLSL